MTNQGLLDSIAIGQSPLTGRVYIGLPKKGKPNELSCKSDFTERLKEFAPQMFQEQCDES